ncbi:virion core protein [Murmansk poxvirus]|uniref:Virion core protein n=1 Tax=Murmansk poxvirus TaxID=2025359 RepID=A0A223FMU4_9POXV|nr:virion core protein [Murmansk poxvirus]AST09316.1 virion core protein [Murmansk poxvirus]
MDKLRVVYDEFVAISKEYLEKETGMTASDVDMDFDLNILMTLIPVLEKKIIPITSDIDNNDILKMMKYCSYQGFSFWFIKSGAVVKSVYNKLDEEKKEKFVNIFKEMLLNVKTLISLNSMYSRLKQDTEDIVSDSKKIMEIISHLRNSVNENAAYQVLQNNHSFISATLNKILSDENYLLKIIAVFDSKLISEKETLNEYKQLYTISTDSLVYGIKCICKLDMSSVQLTNNKYVLFVKKILPKIMLFQNNDVNSQQFANIVSRIYVLIYDQLGSNINVKNLLIETLESAKTKISLEKIKQSGINNIQGIIKFISDNKTEYKSIISEEYLSKEDKIIDILQDIVNEYNITYENKLLNVRSLIKTFREKYSDRF